MTEITLVRHGQAQSQAKDEASYDQLSPLGFEQAQWLGQHLGSTGHGFDRIMSGTLKRQVQTAQNIKQTVDIDHHQDARLNELDYFGLAERLKSLRGTPIPTTPQEFARHMPQVLGAWQAGELLNPSESFAAFQDRINDVVCEMTQHTDRVLMVTSSGVISMVMRLALELDLAATSKVLVSVHHTSLHRVTWHGDHLHMSQFNGTPHLDMAHRTHARTFV